jgi:transcriptional regulator with XRE-family HTH domain
MLLVEKRIRALRAQGLSIREIARELGLSRMRVQRVLASSPAVPLVPADGDSASVAGDPVVSLLTDADLARLGVSRAVMAAGELDALTRYRMLGLPAGSAAGEAARTLFDHGRGGQAWDAWLHAGGEPVS